MDALERFQKLLTEVFQFESSDLDFGIYRILNHKRGQIEKFIWEGLKNKVEAAFARHKDERMTNIGQRFEEAKQKVLQALGPDAITATGELQETFRGTTVGKDFLAAQAQRQQANAIDEIKLQVFNDLYYFFSRYYQEGDFVPQYRYSIKGHKYAIPYDGEEVKLYWANSDQYYTKTGVLFRDYAFTLNQFRIVFRTVSAREELGSNKATKERFFVLDDEAPLEKVGDGTWIVRFQYRELAAEEVKQYDVEGGSTSSRQERINQQSCTNLIGQIADPLLKGQLAAEHKSERPVLLHQISRFTAKNTKDFFIHKNLKKFLSEQLDFFIKAEVLSIETLEKETFLDKHITRAKVVREIGEAIIDFLAQIEDFQKRLWEKKKFVLKTEYVITSDRVPEEFHQEILKNKDQKKEWNDLGMEAAAGKMTGASLKTLHLPVDTKHFTSEFKDHLLDMITEKADLDDLLDGLCIKSENWQALTLLTEKYREKIKCIHIDPPYNTQTSGFLYMNDYQHSSWLAMMENRISASIGLMLPGGSFLCHVDENEFERLQLLFERFPIPNAGTIVWDKTNPMNAGRGVALQHEYIVWRTALQSPIYLRNETVISMLKAAAEIVAKRGAASKEAQKEYAAWIDSNSELSGGEKAYRYLDEQGRVYQSVSLRAPEPRTDPKFHKPLIHPLTKKPCPVPPNGFSRTPEKLQDMVDAGNILFGTDETTQPRQKVLLTEESRRQIPSVIRDGRKGKADVSPLGLDFPYCHPVSLYEGLIGAAVQSSGGDRDIVLDYFGGSGTSGHAVINMNAEEGTKRMYVLVEMANYFDSVLLPRIKKVAFCENWKDGKPAEGNGVSHFLKYQVLEQYEDTLDNIELAPNQQAEFKLGDDYLLKYFLDYETRDNGTLLNIESLRNPFSYKLKVNLEEVGEPKETAVDIPETFNYLLGLKIKKTKTRMDGKRKYQFVLGEKGGKDIAVVWRDCDSDWQDKGLKQDKKFIVQELQPWAPAIVYVNGQSVLTPQLGERTVEIRPIEPEFKRLMEAPVW